MTDGDNTVEPTVEPTVPLDATLDDIEARLVAVENVIAERLIALVSDVPIGPQPADPIDAPTFTRAEVAPAAITAGFDAEGRWRLGKGTVGGGRFAKRGWSGVKRMLTSLARDMADDTRDAPDGRDLYPNVELADRLGIPDGTPVRVRYRDARNGVVNVDGRQLIVGWSELSVDRPADRPDRVIYTDNLRPMPVFTELPPTDEPDAIDPPPNLFSGPNGGVLTNTQPGERTYLAKIVGGDGSGPTHQYQREFINNGYKQRNISTQDGPVKVEVIPQFPGDGLYEFQVEHRDVHGNRKTARRFVLVKDGHVGFPDSDRLVDLQTGADDADWWDPNLNEFDEYTAPGDATRTEVPPADGLPPYRTTDLPDGWVFDPATIVAEARKFNAAYPEAVDLIDTGAGVPVVRATHDTTDPLGKRLLLWRVAGLEFPPSDRFPNGVFIEARDPEVQRRATPPNRDSWALWWGRKIAGPGVMVRAAESGGLRDAPLQPPTLKTMPTQARRSPVDPAAPVATLTDLVERMPRKLTDADVQRRPELVALAADALDQLGPASSSRFIRDVYEQRHYFSDDGPSPLSARQARGVLNALRRDIESYVAAGGGNRADRLLRGDGAAPTLVIGDRDGVREYRIEADGRTVFRSTDRNAAKQALANASTNYRSRGSSDARRAPFPLAATELRPLILDQDPVLDDNVDDPFAEFIPTMVRADRLKPGMVLLDPEFNTPVAAVDHRQRSQAGSGDATYLVLDLEGGRGFYEFRVGRNTEVPVAAGLANRTDSLLPPLLPGRLATERQKQQIRGVIARGLWDRPTPPPSDADIDAMTRDEARTLLRAIREDLLPAPGEDTSWPHDVAWPFAATELPPSAASMFPDPDNTGTFPTTDRVNPDDVRWASEPDPDFPDDTILSTFVVGQAETDKPTGVHQLNAVEATVHEYVDIDDETGTRSSRVSWWVDAANPEGGAYYYSWLSGVAHAWDDPTKPDPSFRSGEADTIEDAQVAAVEAINGLDQNNAVYRPLAGVHGPDGMAAALVAREAADPTPQPLASTFSRRMAGGRDVALSELPPAEVTPNRVESQTAIVGAGSPERPDMWAIRLAGGSYPNASKPGQEVIVRRAGGDPATARFGVGSLAPRDLSDDVLWVYAPVGAPRYRGSSLPTDVLVGVVKTSGPDAALLSGNRVVPVPGSMRDARSTSAVAAWAVEQIGDMEAAAERVTVQSPVAAFAPLDATTPYGVVLIRGFNAMPILDARNVREALRLLDLSDGRRRPFDERDGFPAGTMPLVGARRFSAGPQLAFADGSNGTKVLVLDEASAARWKAAYDQALADQARIPAEIKAVKADRKRLAQINRATGETSVVDVDVSADPAPTLPLPDMDGLPASTDDPTPLSPMPPAERAGSDPDGAWLVAKDGYLSRIGVGRGQAVKVRAVSDTEGEITVIDGADTRPYRVKLSRFSDDAATADTVRVTDPTWTGNATRAKAGRGDTARDAARDAGPEGVMAAAADNYLARHGYPKGSPVRVVYGSDTTAKIVTGDGRTINAGWARFATIDEQIAAGLDGAAAGLDLSTVAGRATFAARLDAATEALSVEALQQYAMAIGIDNPPSTREALFDALARFTNQGTS